MAQQQVQGVAGLKKHDIKVSGIVFMLYCLVAAGAFGIEEMIPEAGPGMTLILLIIFPIIWAYPISNMVAECGSVLPSEGGVYVWVKEAFGEFWGFQAGWWGTVSTYITNGVYVALVAGYVSQMIPMSEVAIHVLKIGMILIFTIINLLGLKEVGKVSTILSILIVLAFALVALVGFLNWNTNPMDPIMPEGYSLIDGVGGGICICVWMYCGYECISNMAGEVKNPQVIPKGLLIAMPLVDLTYVLPTLGGLASLPAGTWENWSTDGGFTGETVGYATVLTANLGPAWGYIFLVVAIVTLILAQKDFTTLVSMEVVFMLALYIILPLAVIKLRKKLPVEERRKRDLFIMPGGRAGLIFYCGFPIAIAVIALLINGTDYFVMGLLATASGPVAYVIVKAVYGGLSKNDPEHYPLNTRTRFAVGDTVRIGAYLIIAGAFGFLGQFWLRWYEIDYGEWGTDDYDMMGDIIPQVLDILKWAGLAALAVGIIVAAIGWKKDRPAPEVRPDIDALLDKYLNEEKRESFFDD